MPEISVIFPVYRAEAFLRKCTESILAQTMGDLEVLLIDDGSPDGSGALCDQIAGEDSRVRVFHKENGGGGAGRVPAPLAARRSSRRSCPAPSRKRPKAASALRSLRSPSAGCGISTGISSSSSRRSPI